MAAWSNTDDQAGKPVVEATTWEIDGSSTDVVDAAADTIVVPNGFETGDPLIYTSSSPIVATPALVSGTTYFAIRVDANTIQLAASAVDADAGTQIDITGVGGATDDTLQALADDLFGVDTNEMAANATEEGAAHAGWNKVTTIGSRKIVETLVAMSKNAFSATDAEDVVFEDYLITIDTQPVDDAQAAGNPVTFTVAASITGTGGTLTYQWEEDPNTGTFAPLADAGVYSGSTTDTLTISDNTGLDLYKYRVVVSATGADDVTSAVATLTIVP